MSADGTDRARRNRPLWSWPGTGRRLGAVALALMVLACTSRVDTHGNLVDLENLVAIVPGETTRAQVRGLLGSPSSTANFDEGVWYYIGDKTAIKAFFAPELLERRVIYIAFDPNGLVDSIGKLDGDDGARVEYVNRQTPTAGQRITLLQQLLGNLGRFNRPVE